MPKQKTNRMFAHLFIVMTGCMAAGSVWAITQPPPELLALPWIQIAVAGLIALWGGVGRTAVRAIEDAQELRDKPGVLTGFNLRVELARDLFVSSGIGFVVYLLGVHHAWDTWLLAPALWLGGYMGTKLLTAFGSAVLSSITQIGNKEKP